MAKGKKESRKSSNRKFKRGTKVKKVNVRKPTRGGTRL
jgi:hypothetical protein